MVDDTRRSWIVWINTITDLNTARLFFTSFYFFLFTVFRTIGIRINSSIVLPITFELMRRFVSEWIFFAGTKISARLLLDFFSNVETSATSAPLNLLLVLWDFSPDKLKFFRIRKSPRMVAVPLSVSHSLSHVAVARLGSALKILQLTHRSFLSPSLTARQLVSDWTLQDGHFAY